MPDNRNKRPLPAVMDVGTFRERFGTDEGCWEHLRNTRWGPNLGRFALEPRSCLHRRSECLLDGISVTVPILYY